jgi:hypothetical protein
MSNEQLRALVRPFPSRYIKANPSGGGTYVAHEVVTQRLLHAVGPFSTTVDQVIRGDVDGIEPNPDGKSMRAKAGHAPLTNVVVGVLLRLTVTIDGREVTVTEVGDCEQPHNWPTDGARMKDAMSDAIKRCAMRLGCGIHLWAQDLFYLHDALAPEVTT